MSLWTPWNVQRAYPVPSGMSLSPFAVGLGAPGTLTEQGGVGA